MAAEVILFVQEGTSEREFSFTAPARCVLGRGEDADIRLRKSGCGFVSRHHCLFDISPPGIRVRDLGSLNGTFVNGQNIGNRNSPQMADGNSRQESRWHTLRGGDIVHAGATRIRVTILTSTAFAGDDALQTRQPNMWNMARRESVAPRA